MQKLQDSMVGLLSRLDLGQYERARQYMQLQNKYFTFKEQLNSRSIESSLPYSEEQRGIQSSNLLADNVPDPILEPVAITLNPVKEPVKLQAVNIQEPVQVVTLQTPVEAATVQTPVTLQATPTKALPPLSTLTTPPTMEAPSLTRK